MLTVKLNLFLNHNQFHPDPNKMTGCSLATPSVVFVTSHCRLTLKTNAYRNLWTDAVSQQWGLKAPFSRRLLLLDQNEFM
jgi:hypothetical protein